MAFVTAAGQAGTSRTVLATATDRRNRLLTTLDEDDFVVRQGGEEREVFAVRLADYPVVLLIDNGREASADFEAIRRAAARFIAGIGAERPVAIGTLANPPVMLTTFDDDRGTVAVAVTALDANPSGDSLVFEGVANAARVIRATGTPFSAIVVISGSEVDATRVPRGELLPPILDSRAIVHIVARRNATAAVPGAAGASAGMLQALTDQTRGQYTSIFSAASYQAALDRLADRLSAEMMIEFIVPESSASDDVKVGVRVPGARVLGLGVTPGCSSGTRSDGKGGNGERRSRPALESVAKLRVCPPVGGPMGRLKPATTNRNAPLSEGLEEEQNQRDEQHVNHERLDQHEAQNQVASNLTRGARIARDAFHSRRNGAGLPQRTERRRDGESEPGRDDRPPDHFRTGRRRFLRMQRRHEADRHHHQCRSHQNTSAHKPSNEHIQT